MLDSPENSLDGPQSILEIAILLIERSLALQINGKDNISKPAAIIGKQTCGDHSRMRIPMEIEI